MNIYLLREHPGQIQIEQLAYEVDVLLKVPLSSLIRLSLTLIPRTVDAKVKKD